MNREQRRPRALKFPHIPGLLAVAFVILIALALRLYKLDAQSLWYDEGNSARIAERPLQLIVEGAAGDIHPPLYYLVLHYWRMLFGDGEAGLRSLSVVCGVLLVLVTYFIGKRLFGPRTGWVAALLVAFSPFAVYYSQEARMYVLLALEAAISTWALFEILDWRFAICDLRQTRNAANPKSQIPNLKSKIFLYVLATAAGLWTQYAYPFVMIAQGVCVLLWLLFARANRGRGVLMYAAMNVAAIALFAPWLPIALRQVTSWAVAPQGYELGQAALDALRWIVVGRTLPAEQATLALAGFAVLVLAGVVADWIAVSPIGSYRAGRRINSASETGKSAKPDSRPRKAGLNSIRAVAMLLILFAVPLALLFVFKLYRESYLKFLLVCVSPLCLLAAHGIVATVEIAASKLRPATPALLEGEHARSDAEGGRCEGVALSVASVALTALLILPLLPSLADLYDNPAYARDDYRGIARTIDAGARPGDAILFDAPNQWEVFTYYHRDANGEHGGAPAIPLAYNPESDAAVAAQLEPLAQRYTRLFVLYYGERESDPAGRFERWLATNAFKAGEQWVGNIRMAVYATRLQAQAQPIGATFSTAGAASIKLVSAALETRPWQAGELIPLRLVWRSDSALNERYKVFVHVGAADAPPVAQNDAEPEAGYRPTTAWQAGKEIVDPRAVWLKPGTPAGRYGLYVGIYDSATGIRLPLASGEDRLMLAEITVVSSP